MIKNPVLCLWLGLPLWMVAQTSAPAVVEKAHGKPACIATAKLSDFDILPADRQKLIAGALTVARDSPWLPYTAGGSRPSDGGFDCSGAMYFVMRAAGLDPPRTAAGQFQWLKDHHRLQEVPADVVDMDHPVMKNLSPGDLLFWGRPAKGESGDEMEITHVAMFLGKETMGQRPVMINSTYGRSYRGTKANGYGVYDFRLPRAGARIAFLGYGTPPGISAMPQPDTPKQGDEEQMVR